MSWVQIVLFIANVFILCFYLLLHGFYFFLLAVSIFAARAQSRRARLLAPESLLDSVVTPPVTILVPAHNEGPTIVESVRALLGLRYPRLEAIVINDGSTDETLSELIHSFSLRRVDLVYDPLLPTHSIRGIYLSNVDPRVVVIDKVQGGKSEALNAGLNLCRTPWVCSVDADSILQEDALLRAMRPAIEDSRVVASGGIVRIANGCRIGGGRVLRAALPSDKLAVYQVIEYLRGFLQGRLGWNALNGLLIISGAFGLFRTDALRAVGGYSSATVAEDMEVVLRIHRHFRERGEPFRVVFVPDAVCWTEAPTRAAALRRQRRRWQRGLAEILSLYKKQFFRPRMGVMGFLALPYFALELAAPVVEIFGFLFVPLAWWLGWLSHYYFVLYLTLAFLLGIMLAVWGVLIEEFCFGRYTSWRDLVRLLGFALTEHVGYHQMVLWWRLGGLYDYLRGRREWGEQARAGFRRPAAAGA